MDATMFVGLGWIAPRTGSTGGGPPSTKVNLWPLPFRCSRYSSCSLRFYCMGPVILLSGPKGAFHSMFSTSLQSKPWALGMALKGPSNKLSIRKPRLYHLNPNMKPEKQRRTQRLPSLRILTPHQAQTIPLLCPAFSGPRTLQALQFRTIA